MIPGFSWVFFFKNTLAPCKCGRVTTGEDPGRTWGRSRGGPGGGPGGGPWEANY